MGLCFLDRTKFTQGHTGWEVYKYFFTKLPKEVASPANLLRSVARRTAGGLVATSCAGVVRRSSRIYKQEPP